MSLMLRLIDVSLQRECNSMLNQEISESFQNAVLADSISTREAAPTSDSDSLCLRRDCVWQSSPNHHISSKCNEDIFII
jgi:hypothetical protein